MLAPLRALAWAQDSEFITNVVRSSTIVVVVFIENKMGFDISGLKASSKRGEYFRNNVWWWRPLADYVLDNVALPAEETENWGTNDGQEVSEESAIKIADTLDELIKSGKTAEYAKKYKAELDSMPLQECTFCKGTGKRNDEHVKGECNACSGEGKVKPFSTNYPFNVENVQDFADFCRDSGGFQIY